MAPEDVREYRATRPTHDPQSGEANTLRLGPEDQLNIPPAYHGLPSGVKDVKHTFSSGASSSGRKPRYDLIPLWALERIAKRFQIGAEKYGENNWQKGVDDK